MELLVEIFTANYFLTVFVLCMCLSVNGFHRHYTLKQGDTWNIVFALRNTNFLRIFVCVCVVWFSNDASHVTFNFWHFHHICEIVRFCIMHIFYLNYFSYLFYQQFLWNISFKGKNLDIIFLWYILVYNETNIYCLCIANPLIDML